MVAPPELAVYPGVLELMKDWDRAARALRSAPLDGAPVVERPVLDLPLRYPRKVLCSGPNYADHLAEMGESFGAQWRPYFFLKPPTTSLVIDGAPILISGAPDDKVDWEGELAVVIGKGGRDIRPGEAMDHVGGYTVVNDISLRGPHRRQEVPPPFVWDWLASKGADTSLPMAFDVVPAWHIDDPQDLVVQTRVNGDMVQSASTSLMVCSVAELVSAASELVTLEPGDVIATGTPSGVGAGRGIFLCAGDEVEVAIPGVGRVCNPVRVRK
ncbi:fumarylacetoacetate hydrolase family protein [Streptomyces sp. NPDC101225]|uniref:fumarylacetoacetate hydrolase family protein n=1 Tax=Streptomyces sp. NPDC101225 TaxID=3366135 RepID=UPI003820B415